MWKKKKSGLCFICHPPDNHTNSHTVSTQPKQPGFGSVRNVVSSASPIRHFSFALSEKTISELTWTSLTAGNSKCRRLTSWRFLHQRGKSLALAFRFPHPHSHQACSLLVSIHSVSSLQTSPHNSLTQQHFTDQNSHRRVGQEGPMWDHLTQQGHSGLLVKCLGHWSWTLTFTSQLCHFLPL